MSNKKSKTIKTPIEYQKWVKEEFIAKEQMNIIKFDSRKSNGKYIFQFESKSFTCNFQIASNDFIRIYNDGSDIKLGANYESKKNISFRNLKQNHLDKFSYTPRIIELRKNEIGIGINAQGEWIKMQLLSAKSSSHGQNEDLIELKYEIM